MKATHPQRLSQLKLSKHLLWEYDLSSFDYDKSWFIVIERVIERGNLVEWWLTQNYYGTQKILTVAKDSRQLSPRLKNFAEVYVNSSFNDPYRSTNYHTRHAEAFESAIKRCQA